MYFEFKIQHLIMLKLECNTRKPRIKTMSPTQNYQTHVRWYPLVHFVITPLLFINLVWQIIQLEQEKSLDRAESLLLAFTLLLMSLAARIQALRAQDRVIRLEEKLRYKQVLSPEVAVQAANMRVGQIIALRFAPDEELPGLIHRVLNGELEKGKDIKLAIKNWRGDHLRV